MLNKKIKILYIISNIDKALAFEWVNEYLNKELFEISFVILGEGNSALYNYLSKTETPVYHIQYRGKKDIVKSLIKLLKIIRASRPSVVHTHLFEANLVGLTAALLLRVKKRIYTRHHATIHYKEFKKGLKWDKLCNFIATDIVAISNNIRQILIDWDKVDASKVHLIHHGFKFEYFTNIESARIENLKLKYSILTSYKPIIGVISRYMEWKGVQFSIQAFKLLLKKYPSAHLILANAQGDYSGEIKLLLADLPPASYTEIVFEYDLAALYKLFDIFIHVPIDTQSEAFGQTYVEALAAGIPSIFSQSGIACDFIQHEENALVVAHKDANKICESIERLLCDDALTKKIVYCGRQSVYERFSIESMIKKLETLYLS